VNIVQIGNSKGIRIPKAVLEQCNVGSELSMEIENGKIVLEPVRRRPRQGWAEAFQQMHANAEDELLIDDAVDLDLDEWEW
jgi:antitoxin MazE